MESSDRARARERAYRRLPGGRGLDADEVLRHQRRRLELAMIEACAREGYPQTKVADVVALAGVSKSAFYAQFDDKEDCFLATMDGLVSRALAQVEAAVAEADGWEAGLAAGVGRLLELAAGNPAAAALVCVESLTLGGPGLKSRERLTNSFEGVLAEVMGKASARAAMAATTIRAIVQGLYVTIYRALRKGAAEELVGQGPELIAWIHGYLRPSAVHGPGERPDFGPPPQGRLLWDFEPNSPEARIEHDQRERVIQAVVRLAVEAGGNLTVPLISGRAGISNQAFYKHFANKQEALFAPFDVFMKSAAAAAAPRFFAAERWEDGVCDGLEAAIEFIASEPEFAWVAYVEESVGGGEALDHSDAGMAAFESLLSAETGAPVEVSPLIRTAVIGGIFGSVQVAIGEGNLTKLRSHIPELLAFLLTPFEP